ncbi:hypothetical protein ACFOLF_21270 [Paenibacillus sepulcri]|uniref:Acyl carrier protein n=1 Tax=Paenibacillus sepulcri TaxID=359917 RepID=A0ABS7BWK9_9BACL|nr:hypothetical protein [Paenibacillus sepulcri]
MLDLVKQFIEKLIAGFDKTITIESEVMYGNSKLEYALSTEHYMASISVLSDFTYDFFAMEIISGEDPLLLNMKQFDSIENLFTELTKDIISFSDL